MEYIYINVAICSLLDEHKPVEIAETLEVTQAMVSIWKNKENDFTPRVGVAAKILEHYDILVYPYSEEALREVLEHEALQTSRRH